jgi:5-formyltetrahydrofolate cyclo-ligase
MTDPTVHHKSDLRSRMRARLASMSEQERRTASAAACARLMALEAFQQAHTVMLYMPLALEVDLTPVALRCFQTGRVVCVPKVDWKRRDMRPVEIDSFDDNVMEVDEHGLRSPRDGRPVLPTTIDLAAVPGLAFDTSGRRLGRGGGFYDRFLSTLRSTARTAGVAFDLQIVDNLPTDTHDIAVDLLVTDRRSTVARPSPTHR